MKIIQAISRLWKERLHLTMPKSAVPPHILPVIVFAQFAGTSLWFAGSAIAADLQHALQLPADVLGNITSAVQLGFISGTLVFAVFSVADRFSPSGVFLFSALAGACVNLCIYWFAKDVVSLLVFRFLTGFFLAGIYPVGMKIAADWFASGLGKALGYLVGALVVGTAFPHLLKATSANLPWQEILFATSGLAATGGVLLFFTVGDGPDRQPAPSFRWSTIPQIFRFENFRSAAFGYFGHMWELYALWAFLPAMLLAYNTIQQESLSVSLWSFLIMAAGGLGCIAGGYMSLKKGSQKVAFGMLLASGLCCLVSPLLFFLPKWLFLGILCCWGFAVVGDSPQFSTLAARTAPRIYIGTALTIVNCIGFALTIVSIQLLSFLQAKISPQWWFLFLLPGPILGLISIRRLKNHKI